MKMTIHELIMERIAESESAEPRDLAREVLALVPDEELRPALAELLPQAIALRVVSKAILEGLWTAGRDLHEATA